MYHARLFGCMAILLSGSVTPACKQRTSTLSAANGKGITRLAFQNDKAYLMAEILRDDLIHFETGQGKAPSTNQALYHTPMVLKNDYTGPTQLASQSDGFETARLTVKVDSHTLCVEVVDKTIGQTLHETCPSRLDQSWKGLSLKSPATTHVYGLGQYFTNPGSADGDWLGRQWDPGYDTYGNSLRGFSGGANGVTQIPVMYALGKPGHQYAIFLDQAYKLMWDFKTQPWKVDMNGDQIRWYVLGGNSLRDLRRSYMELTGRPPVPPKKVLGLFVSEFGYLSWDELRDRLSALEQNNFPVDGFGLDLQWFGGDFYERGADTRGSRMGTLSFDPKGFPNANAVVKDLRDQHGVSLLAIEESYVSKFLPIHDSMAKQAYLVQQCDSQNPVYLDANPWWGVGGMIDWTNPEAAAYWFREKRLALANMGITLHWTDLGEPEMFDPNGCYHGFPEIKKNRHADVHNLYNFLWLDGIARGYKDHALKLRPYMMSRSGASGMQRFGAGMWSGDIGANMGALTGHLNAQMHMSLAGIDYYGSDVGGFHRRPDTLDGDENALFTQWFANSSLFDTPVRSHAWNVKKTLKTSPIDIGDKASNLYNIRQRYALAPYYYSLAHEANLQGEPLIPPLVYHFPNDMNVRSMGNQKMIGPWLMAAVVARYGETARDVYLPAGRWADFHTQRWYTSNGNQVPNIPATQDGIFRIPLFARAGAIIPMAYVDDKTSNILGKRRDNTRRDDLIIRVFPDRQRSTFTLYEDDGETIAYQQGAKSSTVISQVANDQELTVSIAASQGSYQVPKDRPVTVELVLNGESVRQVHWNGKALNPCAAGTTDAKRDLAQACWRMADTQRLVVYGGILSRDVPKSLSLAFNKT